MRKRTSKALKVTVTVGFAVVALLSGVPGIVLCIGDDGHVALEPAHHGHCGEDAHADGHEEQNRPAAFAAGDTCCPGDCIDVELPWGELTLAITKTRHIGSEAGTPPPATALFSQTVDWLCRGGPPVALRAGPGLPSSTLLAQKTIVLRV